MAEPATFHAIPPPPRQLELVYRDGRGQVLARKVSVTSLGVIPGEGDSLVLTHLRGYCHLRKTSRTFAVRGIVMAMDAQTYEPIPSLSAWFQKRADAALADYRALNRPAPEAPTQPDRLARRAAEATGAIRQQWSRLDPPDPPKPDRSLQTMIIWAGVVLVVALWVLALLPLLRGGGEPANTAIVADRPQPTRAPEHIDREPRREGDHRVAPDHPRW